MSREMRPVFVEEMNLLGFDRYWRYDPDWRGPYLLASRGSYYIGGTRVAAVHGGNFLSDPVLEPLWQIGARMYPMEGIPRGKRSLASLIDETLERTTYVLRNTPYDRSYFGFSGGKDSLVMVHLLASKFPEAVVAFADTGMELPGTACTVDWTRQWCETEGLTFHRVPPRFSMAEAWTLFGTPSRSIRWCCSVCKSAAQLNSLRALWGTAKVVTIAVTGVRGAESPRRAKYQDLEYSKKVNGQWQFHPLFKWSSLDVWTYLLRHKLPIHEAYRAGMNRVGCIVCPLASCRHEWITEKIYPEETKKAIDLADGLINEIPKNGQSHRNFVLSGGWKRRFTSKLLAFPFDTYSEEYDENGDLIVNVSKTNTDWKEWLKTINVPFSYAIDENLRGGGQDLHPNGSKERAPRRLVSLPQRLPEGGVLRRLRSMRGGLPPWGALVRRVAPGAYPRLPAMRGLPRSRERLHPFQGRGQDARK